MKLAHLFESSKSRSNALLFQQHIIDDDDLIVRNIDIKMTAEGGLTIVHLSHEFIDEKIAFTSNGKMIIVSDIEPFDEPFSDATAAGQVREILPTLLCQKAGRMIENNADCKAVGYFCDSDPHSSSATLTIERAHVEQNTTFEWNVAKQCFITEDDTVEHRTVAGMISYCSNTDTYPDMSAADDGDDGYDD